MKLNIRTILLLLGSVLLFAGYILHLFKYAWVPYVVIVGGGLFAIAQITAKLEGEDTVTRRRLLRQQQFGALCFVFSGIFMLFTHGNEWVVALLIGCILELYTSFRL